MSRKLGDWFRSNYRSIIITSLVIVPFLVSLISTIHVVNFFELSNFAWLAVTLAVAFEVGALSSLAALAVMDKLNKVSLWIIFILITMMQMMGNTYYAFDFITTKMKISPEWTQNWIDLFSIQGAEMAATKRILAIVSGAILPVISLTFLHLLITYISKTRASDEEEYEYITVDQDGNEIIEDDEPIKEKDPEICKVCKKPVLECVCGIASGDPDNFFEMEQLRRDVKELQNTITNMSQPKKEVIDYIAPEPAFNPSDVIQEPIIKESQPISEQHVEPELIQNIRRASTRSNPVNPEDIEEIKPKPSTDLTPLLYELLKKISPNSTEKDATQLKEQLELIATPGKNGEIQIDLTKIFKPTIGQSNLNIPTNPPNVKLNPKHNPNIKLNDAKNGLTITSNDDIRTTPGNTPAIIVDKKPDEITVTLTNPEPVISESTPVENVVETINQEPEIEEKIETQIEDIQPEPIPIPEIIKDTTFEEPINQSPEIEEKITENIQPPAELDQLKEPSVPQKKKILLYKEKKN